MTGKIEYNPNIHHRKSIRLKGYDYSQAGLYFITICCQDRECLFGEIAGANNDLPEMILNDVGQIANDCWLEIPNHFPNCILHEHIVMPNHVHGIIELTTVGAENFLPENAQTNRMGAENNIGDNVGAENFLPLPPQRPQRNEFQKMIPRSVGSIVKGFKIGVTVRVRAENILPLQSEQKIWQRNYYEHIIRNDESYQNISNYIINNPFKWTDDKFFK